MAYSSRNRKGPKSPLPLLIVILLCVCVLGAVGYHFFVPRAQQRTPKQAPSMKAEGRSHGSSVASEASAPATGGKTPSSPASTALPAPAPPPGLLGSLEQRPVQTQFFSMAFGQGLDGMEGWKQSDLFYAGPYRLRVEIEVTEYPNGKVKWPGYQLLSVGSAGQVFLEPDGNALLLVRESELRIGKAYEPRVLSKAPFPYTLLRRKVVLELVWDGRLCTVLLNGHLWASLPARGTKFFNTAQIGPFPGKIFAASLATD